MKKNSIILIFCIILILSCSSCGWFSPQRYVCDAEAVDSIQIVRLDRYVEGEYRYEYTVLSQISDIDIFVSRLNELDHSVNWGDPGTMDVQYVVIKIDYLNGDFDLLYPNAQCFNRSGENQSGYFFFDAEEFDLLISDYTSEE